MKTKQLVNDTVTRALAKYHETFTKSIQRQLNDLEARVEVVEDSALDIESLSSNELDEIFDNDNN